MRRTHRRLPRVAVLALAALAGCGGPPSPDPAPGATNAAPAWFEEIAAERGLDFRHRSGHEERYLFPEIVGGGVALFDMDGDADLDAYLVQSGRLDGTGEGNRLYRNDGSGRFEDVTDGSGAGDRGYGMGVAAGDADGDGDTDLYVTNLGPNALLLNDGQGRFTDATGRAGVGDPGWSTSAAFFDHDLDGDLDLYVVNYVNWQPSTEQECYHKTGLPDYCLPTNYNAPATDRLYRNDGDARFTDVTAEAGIDRAFGNGLGVVVSNFDGNGRPDVFVANDTMMNQLWIHHGDEGFRDEALLRGCALDEHGVAKAGMGVEARDLDDDGDSDLLVVNLEGQTDSYFRNTDGFFDDRTGAIGLAGAPRSYTRFGIGLADFDNDGRLDLYEANGSVIFDAAAATGDPYAQPNLLLRGTPGGRFEPVEPLGGTATPLVHTSRGVAFGDVDGDGGVDAVVVNRDGPAYLLRNVHPRRGHWVGFRVLDANGADALGATVRLRAGDRTVVRDVRAAYGYCASHDPRVHVGLGPAAEVADVTVTWPDGRREGFGSFEAGSWVELRRGRGSAL